MAAAGTRVLLGVAGLVKTVEAGMAFREFLICMQYVHIALTALACILSYDLISFFDFLVWVWQMDGAEIKGLLEKMD